MCGIAGLIHRGKSSNVGSELQLMLQALKHRGPDSTGYALYAENDGQNFIMRFKVGENVGEGSTSINEDSSVYDKRKKMVDQMLSELGAKVIKEDRLTPYSFRYEMQFNDDLMEFSKKIESIESVEILSIGKSLELIKDLGDAEAVSKRYGLADVKGTHAIGHARMATESGVDIKSAHPFWGYPFSDVSVVHNGINYLNCGDWVESCTALAENYDGSFEILYWDKIREKFIDAEKAIKPIKTEELKKAS